MSARRSKRSGSSRGKVMQLLYTAVEGHRAGLPLFDAIHLLGRKRTLARLRAARARIGSDPEGGTR